MTYALKVILTLSLLCVAAAFVVVFSVVTCGQAQQMLSEKVVPFFSKVILAVHGIRVDLLGQELFPKGQCIVIANHRSTLDVLVVTSLGLPRVRYFLSRKTKIIFPMWIIGRALNTFYTPPQSSPTERTELFQKACAELKRTGDSAFLTPEGTRTDQPLVGHFNKGAFHLAMSLGVPLVPLYISTPARSNPGRGWRIRSGGMVTVRIEKPVSCENWSEEGLARHAQEVRSLYLGWQGA